MSCDLPFIFFFALPPCRSVSDTCPFVKGFFEPKAALILCTHTRPTGSTSAEICTNIPAAFSGVCSVQRTHSPSHNSLSPQHRGNCAVPVV
ncbi:hypothetical protein BDD12DRAFT_836741 [Trichophaea hybrida]|nr:hypothetical protein BDD12DRAFT_836741 [Trichophaea hybrida]